MPFTFPCLCIGRSSARRPYENYVDNIKKISSLFAICHFNSEEYQRSGDREALNRTIEAAQSLDRLIIRSLLEGFPGEFRCLAILVVHCGLRYDLDHNLDDLDLTIAFGRRAIRFDETHATFLASQGKYTSIRYFVRGNLEDLTESITCSRKAVELGVEDSLIWIGSALIRLYEAYGSRNDLEEAINIKSHLINQATEDEVKWVSHADLGHCFSLRYDLTGSKEDLDRAVNNCQQALSLTKDDNPVKAIYYTNMGILESKIHDRHSHPEDREHIDRRNQQAADIALKLGLNMAMILERQGNSLHRLYSQDKHLQHLNKAIENCEQASKQSMPKPIDQAHYLNALGVVLHERYCYSKDADTDDLNRAIQNGLKAIKLVPPHFYQIAPYFGNLSLFLSTRYSKDKDPEDLENAISWGQKAWESTQCRPRDRIVACQATIFLLAAAQRWEEAKKLAMEACRLLSSVTSRLESKADRACFAQVAPRVADEGCSVALQCQGPNAQHEALQILEMSRGTIHRLALKDFEDSVNHQDFSPASSSAHDADTLRVIVNTTSIRTDAILVKNNGDVQTLNLSGEIFHTAISYHTQLSTRFGFDTIAEGEDKGEKWKQANSDMRIFLKWLWDMIVYPVLHLSGHDTSDDCPPYNACQPHTPDIGNSQDFDDDSKSAGYHVKQRIHWIGVGILSAFPFHAAGYGKESLKMNTMSHVISSSASTLKTLSLAQQKALTLD